MPNLNDVHINQALTNFSIGYHPRGLVARQVLDVVPVKKESDKYYVWNRLDNARVPNTLRADGAESNTVNFDLSSATYQCEEYALKAKITRRQEQNADSVLGLKRAKTMRVKDLIELDLEKRVATLMTTQANFASTNRVQLSGVQQFNNASFTGSIEQRIDTGKDAVRQQTMGLSPDLIVIPAAVAKVVKRDPTIRELIKYTQNDLLVNGDLPPTLFGMKVVIPDAANVTSRKGASSATIADVWGKHIVMLVSGMGRGMIDEVSFAKMFQVTSAELVKEWYEDKLNSTFVEYSNIYDVQITSNVAGYLIEDAIA